MKSKKLSEIVILDIKGADYCYIINKISKIEAINLLKNFDLTEKSGTLFIKHKHLLSYIKMGKEIMKIGDTKLKNIFFTTIKLLFLEDVDIKNVLASNKISSGEKIGDTLLVTCMMIIE